MKTQHILGVDIGGSGIKGSLVDVTTGKLIGDRIRLDTPEGATPQGVATTFAKLVKKLKYKGPVGCGFPAIVKYGEARSASNIDKSWIGHNIEQELSEASGCTVKVLNDADAAGIGEIKFGGGDNAKGVVILITIGTGLGSALFIDGKLVPNTEFGHFIMHGRIAERYASSKVKDDEKLSWKEWAERFSEYLQHLERLFTPDLFILGGGASKDFKEFGHFLKVNTPVTPAKLLNNAGIVGAALYAEGETA
jgi:polyphosphate glucokinase